MAIKESVSNKIVMYNFIMTLCIVAYHFSLNVQVKKHWTESILKYFNYFFDGLGLLAMCTFFLISGFLLFNNANNSEDILKKMKRRIFSLLVPFILWNLISFIFFYNIRTFKSFILGFIILPYNGPTWYLLALSILMMFSPLIIKLKSNKNLTIIVFSLSIILAYSLNRFENSIIIYDTIVEEIWYVRNIFSYLPLYLIGAFTGMYYSKAILQETYNTKKAKIISLLIFIPAFFMLFVDVAHSISLILVGTSFWFIFDSNLFKNKPLKAFNVSFLIYVMHVPFLIKLSTNILFLIINPNGALPIMIGLGRVLGTFIVWMSAIVFDWVFKLMYGDKFYGFFMGNRTSNRKQ